jgi:anti-anti-sigma factor
VTEATHSRRFRVSCERSEALSIVRLGGESDLLAVGEIERVLRVETALAHRIVVDCAELAFIDCEVIGALMRARADVQAAGGTLVVAHAHGSVARVFHVLGFSDLLDGSSDS